MLKLTNLRSPGATKNRKRIGRGQGSGQGTQAGKGHKGQKARSGGSIRLGYEGGQMPIYRRLPKRGFSNEVFKKEFAIINLGLIDKNLEGNVVSRETLILSGLLSGINKKLDIKILAKGDFSKKFTFEGITLFSEKAKEIILKNGSVIK